MSKYIDTAVTLHGRRIEIKSTGTKRKKAFRLLNRFQSSTYFIDVDPCICYNCFIL